MKYNSLDSNVVAGSGFDRRHDLCKCAWGHPSLQEVARVANHRECLPGTSLAIRNDCSCVIRQFGNLNIYILLVAEYLQSYPRGYVLVMGLRVFSRRTHSKAGRVELAILCAYIESNVGTCLKSTNHFCHPELSPQLSRNSLGTQSLA